MLTSTDAWTKAQAAIAYRHITGDRDRGAGVLAEVLGRPGEPALPVHVVAVQALADMRILLTRAVDRVREFRDSTRRVLHTGWPAEIPHPDDQLRDAAERALTH